MQRLLLATLALGLSACADSVLTTPSPESAPRWGTTEPQRETDAPPLQLGLPDAVAPRVVTLPNGSWVRDEAGGCVEREDWLVIGSGGQLDHVLADRNSCGAPSLARYVGRWSTDQQVAHLRWSNGSEDADRETTYWASEETLQLGAYVPVDAGWHRRESLEREIGGFVERHSVDVGLRIDDLELRDGASCVMSATVAVEVDDTAVTELFEFECGVTAREDGFVIAAQGMWQGGGWHSYLERRDVWARHGVDVGNAIYEGFQPVFFTVDGEALWHERADSVYRFTQDSPPVSADELGD